MADEAKTPDPDAPDNQVPEWVPEKFRSNPEKFAESYTELERRLTEESQARSALETNYTELTQQVEQIQSQQTQNQNQTAADPWVAAYETAMENGDYKTALGIQTQLAQMAAQNTVQAALPQVQQNYQTAEERTSELVVNAAATELAAQYGEKWVAAKDDMESLIKAQPWLIPTESTRSVDTARAAMDNLYKLATYGKTQPVDNTEMKQQAQTATGAGGRPLTPDAAAEEWKQIAAAAPKTYY